MKKMGEKFFVDVVHNFFLFIEKYLSMSIKRMTKKEFHLSIIAIKFHFEI